MAARKSEMMDAIENLAKAKDISLDQIVSAVEEGCKAAYRRNVKTGIPPVNLSVVLSREHDVQIFARKVVSEVVEDDSQQISLEEARAEYDDVFIIAGFYIRDYGSRPMRHYQVLSRISSRYYRQEGRS